jgi:CDP-diacylglycerol--glycerol-3-phosphate 3-phosphatidyltransferase
MNLPNKLTMLRIIMIPFVVVFLLARPIGDVSDYVALVLFIAASLTDMADGKIARKYNLITNFGKFMDPLADKLLVCCSMICLVQLGRIPAWIVCIIVAREFAISGFRLIAAEKGTVIAANYWGKFKTTFQMIMIILMILNVPALSILTTIIMWIATALTIISLVTYIAQNKDVLKDAD